MTKRAAQQRQYPRRKTKTSNVPGKFLTLETGRPIPCEIVDVSKNGLGIRSDAAIFPDYNFLLVLDEVNLQIKLTIVWALAETKDKTFYRYGLEVINTDDDLDLCSVFRDLGL